MYLKLIKNAFKKLLSEKKGVSVYWRWVKHYCEEILILLTFIGLFLTVQLIGCGETQFSFDPPATCLDLIGSDLEDFDCNATNRILSPQDIDLVCLNNPDAPVCQDDSVRPPVTDTDGNSTYAPVERRPEDPPSSIEYTSTYNLGKVDILFAVDNSRSMHIEHENIANQFDQFLDDIQDLDYRIAMTTVDISDSPNNITRDYQDGEFIEFENGDKYLSNDRTARSSRQRQHQDNIRLFKKAIKRPESIECLTDATACPDDERAICALNKSLDISSQRDFFRKDGHLMVVIISDEDERSSQEYIDIQRRLGNDYEYTRCDDFHAFYRNVQERVSQYKSVSVHAIIIPPGDSRCLSDQDVTEGKGFYGELYALFAQPSRAIRQQYPNVQKGSVSSICDSNYSSQLGQLSRYLLDPVPPITLACQPQEVRIRLADDNSREIDHRVDGHTLTVTDDRIPLTARLRVTVVCGS